MTYTEAEKRKKMYVSKCLYCGRVHTGESVNDIPELCSSCQAALPAPEYVSNEKEMKDIKAAAKEGVIEVLTDLNVIKASRQGENTDDKRVADFVKKAKNTANGIKNNIENSYSTTSQYIEHNAEEETKDFLPTGVSVVGGLVAMIAVFIYTFSVCVQNGKDGGDSFMLAFVPEILLVVSSIILGNLISIILKKIYVKKHKEEILGNAVGFYQKDFSRTTDALINEFNELQTELDRLIKNPETKESSKQLAVKTYENCRNDVMEQYPYPDTVRDNLNNEITEIKTSYSSKIFVLMFGLVCTIALGCLVPFLLRCSAYNGKVETEEIHCTVCDIQSSFGEYTFGLQDSKGNIRYLTLANKEELPEVRDVYKTGDELTVVYKKNYQFTLETGKTVLAEYYIDNYQFRLSDQYQIK